MILKKNNKENFKGLLVWNEFLDIPFMGYCFFLTFQEWAI